MQMEMTNLAFTCFSLMVLSNNAANGINKFHHHVESKPLNKPDSTLVLTTVICRHGNRAPEKQETYPNNPLKNVSFFPYNYGDLTRTGQRTIYKNGQELQSRYESFLGDLYYNDLVNATSSSSKRCQMSMQALLAGLFASRTSNPVKNLYWQAVPYDIIPPKEDIYLDVPVTCPKILEAVDEPEYISPETRVLFNYIKNYSGFENVSFLETLLIYDFTRSAIEAGYETPEWLKPMYPEPLRKLVVETWNLITKQYLRVMAGPLLKRITQEAMAKEDGSLRPGNRKMFIYSGHDLNIYAILQALNLWEGEEMKYGAYMLFELHQVNGVFGFKIYLQNHYHEPRLLDIPNCGKFCPISEFYNLTQCLYNPNPVC